MNEMIKLIASFVNVSLITVFKDAPKKKLNRDKFKKEIKAACNYGSLCLCQTILDNHKKEPYEDVDTLIGDIQIELVRAFKASNKELNLFVAPHTLENAIQFGGVRPEREQ